jgi:hypothetical protein
MKPRVDEIQPCENEMCSDLERMGCCLARMRYSLMWMRCSLERMIKALSS